MVNSEHRVACVVRICLFEHNLLILVPAKDCADIPRRVCCVNERAPSNKIDNLEAVTVLFLVGRFLEGNRLIVEFLLMQVSAVSVVRHSKIV